MGHKRKSGRQVPRRLSIVVVGQSATLTNKGAEAFETNITEHRKDDENRDMLAGMKHKVRKPVNEQTEGHPERKPRVIMYHHVLFAQMTTFAIDDAVVKDLALERPRTASVNCRTNQPRAVRFCTV
jgi:hypothetical protein